MEHNVVRDAAPDRQGGCRAVLGPAVEQEALQDQHPVGAIQSAKHESDALGAVHRAATEDAIPDPLAARSAEKSAAREQGVLAPGEADLQPEALELCIPAVARFAA